MIGKSDLFKQFLVVAAVLSILLLNKSLILSAFSDRVEVYLTDTPTNITSGGDRYALMLFGIPRWIEDMEVFNNLKDLGMLGDDVDVFAHVWDEPNDVNTKITSGWGNENPSVITRASVDLVETLYKPLKMRIDPLMPDRSLKLDAFNQYRADESIAHNVLSQLLSIEYVANLTSDYMKQYNFTYKLGIVLRYDILCESLPHLRTLDKQKVYISDEARGDFPDYWVIIDGLGIPHALQAFTNVNSNWNGVTTLPFSPENSKYLQVLKYYNHSQISKVFGPCERKSVLENFHK